MIVDDYFLLAKNSPDLLGETEKGHRTTSKIKILDHNKISYIIFERCTSSTVFILELSTKSLYLTLTLLEFHLCVMYRITF